MPRLLFAACLLLLATAARAQGAGSIFPGLSGAPLLDSLVAHYKPGVVLPYNIARDTLFAKVYKQGDSLRCMYTDHALYLAPDQDPTQYVYQNGMNNGMNTEHAYPQSKGAGDGNARSDMHHLYPTRIAVNSARGDNPYADIPDAQTSLWYYRNQQFSTMPTQNKDWYTETRNNLFEPRESVKGDAARAVFYFFTMYKAEALAADPNFFELMRPTLCQWNGQDPPSAIEIERTNKIAPYQENKPNPFVLDCSLAYRCYCSGFQAPPACQTSSTDENAATALPVALSPNPAGGPVRLDLTLPFPGDLRLRVLTAEGKAAGEYTFAALPAGPHTLVWNLPDTLPAGLALLDVQLTGVSGRAGQMLRFVRSR